MRRIVKVMPCSIVDTGADLVVNGSNPAAILGGGVSRALSDECGGGEILQQEMREKLEADLGGELGPGQCLVTSAGRSRKIRRLLHVASVDFRVSPRSTPERVAEATEAATRAAIALAMDVDRVSVAFPLLGAGSGGLSGGVSLRAMITGMRRVFREDTDAPIDRVVFAVPEPALFERMKQRLDQLLVLR